MSLLSSYNINFSTTESVGSDSSNYREQSDNFLLQSNNNIVQNGKSFKLPYLLIPSQVITINLSTLGIKYLKSVCMETTQTVVFSYGTSTIEASILLIDKPIVTSTVLDTNNITITNTSTETINLTLFIVGLV